MTTALTAQEQRQGMRYAFIGQSVGILLNMLVTRSAFGILFLKHLGATDTAAMWFLSVPALMPLIQVPVSLLVPPGYAKGGLILGWALYAGLMALAALVPAVGLPPGEVHLWVIGAWVLALVVNMAGSTFWFPLLHDVIPADRRGRFFGRLRATWGALLYLAVVGSGVYLGETPDTARFQTVMLVGVGLAGLRCLLVARIPAVQRTRLAHPAGNPLVLLGEILRNPPLRRFLGYYTLVTFSAGFLGHPLVLYMREIGFNPRDNILVFGSATLGTVAALFFGGRVLDRLGTLSLFKAIHVAFLLIQAGVLLITFAPLPWVLPLLILAFILSGAFLALSNLACTTHMFAFVPEEGRIFHLTFANLMLIVGPAAATFVTGIVLQLSPGHTPLPLAGTSCGVYQLLLLAALLLALLSTPLLVRVLRPK